LKRTPTVRAFVLTAVIVLLLVGGFLLRQRAKARSARPVEFRSTQEMVLWLADQGVALARDNHVVLDYSEESIEKAEFVLGKLHEEYRTGKLTHGTNGPAMAMGAYVGECIRRHEPGAHWERDHPIGGEKSYPLHWRGGESFPMAWCYKRIVNGPEDNVWIKYSLIRDGRAGQAATNSG
jgi:hypothetical protein